LLSGTNDKRMMSSPGMQAGAHGSLSHQRLRSVADGKATLTYK
jgi:hypothetical protein